MKTVNTMHKILVSRHISTPEGNTHTVLKHMACVI
jgi:hypothetical protein